MVFKTLLPMKTYIFLLSLLPSILLSAQQPQWLNPKPFGGEMYDIEFFDTTRGLMVGRFGNIAITNDGAQSWQLMSSMTSSDLMDIEICGPQSAIIQGDTFLLRTDDGGNTFTSIGNLDSGWYYSAISMVNQNLGYAARTQVLPFNLVQWGISLNGGVNWQWFEFNSISLSTIYSIKFADSLNGVIIYQSPEYSKKIAITNDGGQNWNDKLVLYNTGMELGNILTYAGNGVFYLAYSYYTEQSFWPSIIKSNDYGVTWSTLNIETGSLTEWTSLKCFDESVAIAVGSYYIGKDLIETSSTAKNVFITTDGGQNWQAATKPNGISINNCTAAGIRTNTDAYIWTSNTDNKQLLLTHNLNDFVLEDNVFQAFIMDVQVKEKARFMLVGENYGSLKSNILKSLDNGNTWNPLPNPTGVYKVITEIDFVDENTGFAQVIDNPFLYLTTDGGLIWQQLSIVGLDWGGELNTFGFENTFLFIQELIDPPLPNQLFISSNLGNSWSSLQIPFDTLNFMHFITPDTGFLFGGGKTTANGGYYLTQNAGQSWDFHDLGIPSLSRGLMLSATEGYVAASGNPHKLYYVLNDAAQLVFEADSTHIITDFAFSDASHGYLITTKGEHSWLHATEDGGQTWLTYGPYSTLNGVKTFYDGNGYAYGDYGVLLQLGNGYPVGQTSLPQPNATAKAWPNPASVQLQLSLPDFAHQGAALRITTTSGGLVHEQQVSGTQASIALDNWPSGVYLYTLSTPYNKVTGKFVVK
jgi:photosystem II stability/assembly factor-like uncharacterized protein